MRQANAPSSGVTSGRSDAPRPAAHRGLASTLLLSLLFFSGMLCSTQEAVFGAEESIVLEESQIFGKSPPTENKPEVASSDRPALSTAFPWDGEEQATFNIPEEILNDLTKPDPAYLSGEAIESEEEKK